MTNNLNICEGVTTTTPQIKAGGLSQQMFSGYYICEILVVRYGLETFSVVVLYNQ